MRGIQRLFAVKSGILVFDFRDENDKIYELDQSKIKRIIKKNISKC